MSAAFSHMTQASKPRAGLRATYAWSPFQCEAKEKPCKLF
jgi:hypothetical protein